MSESRDANIRWVVKSGLLLLLALGVINLALWGVFKLFATPSEPSPFGPGRQARVQTAPPLQIAPSLDLEALKASERRQLTTYDWVDREQGLIRVPIERAMDLLVSQKRRVPELP